MKFILVETCENCPYLDKYMGEPYCNNIKEDIIYLGKFHVDCPLEEYDPLTEIGKPIIGQEAICPDGLGRVVNYRYCKGEVSWITVSTYVNDRKCEWDMKNVELIDPRK